MMIAVQGINYVGCLLCCLFKYMNMETLHKYQNIIQSVLVLTILSCK